MSDLRILLNAASETISRTLFAGLRRSAFGASASGANTNPPCMSPAITATHSALINAGKTQCIASMDVQNKSGPAGSTELDRDEFSTMRKKVDQRGSAPRPMNQITPAVAAMLSAPLNSRERVTCPRSRARLRWRGVACSVLLESAISSMRQMKQVIGSGN